MAVHMDVQGCEPPPPYRCWLLKVHTPVSEGIMYANGYKRAVIDGVDDAKTRTFPLIGYGMIPLLEQRRAATGIHNEQGIREIMDKMFESASGIIQR